MQEVDLASLSANVVLATFVLAFIFGMALQRTHFCTMGAVSDIVNMGDWTRMRMWLLAIAVAILGTGMLASGGVIDPANSVYTTPRLTWLSSVAGGILFGIGMVLASGCGSKTLVRIGGGNLKALFVFVVLGISATMAMKGVFAVARVNSIDLVAVDLPTQQDLPSIIAGVTGAALPTVQLVLAASIGTLLLVVALSSRAMWTFDNIGGGVIPGLTIVGVWYVSGHLGYLAEHPETLDKAFLATNSGRMESLSFVAPYAYTLDWLMMWSDVSKVITLGIAAALGVIAGSFVHALATRSFRWEGFGGTEDTANHFVGAVLMGVGGVAAMGCTVGQGLSGVSTLAIGSFLTLAAIIAGALLALRYQAWRLERM